MLDINQLHSIKEEYSNCTIRFLNTRVSQGEYIYTLQYQQELAYDDWHLLGEATKEDVEQVFELQRAIQVSI